MAMGLSAGLTAKEALMANVGLILDFATITKIKNEALNKEV